ncbi:coiled-coil domain-containing protein 69 [Suncus etruscus]|uniref:coiled-coil domain-containing protein 69 n=1 Tax=Suncus etruscus TaxID=109475 RepID=UPI002110432E|nr:coiled-coil domain-containing protein 69 [Suncus etruscus]
MVTTMFVTMVLTNGETATAEGLLPEALAPALGPHFPAQFLAPGALQALPKSLRPGLPRLCSSDIYGAPPPAPLKSAGSGSFSFGVPQRPSRPAQTLSDPGSQRRRMGCARSRPSCCRPPRKRRHEAPEPPGVHHQEQRPLGQNTVAVQPSCAPKQEPSTDLSWVPQQHEKEEKNWAQQVEQEKELQKRMELQRSVLEAEEQGQEEQQGSPTCREKEVPVCREGVPVAQNLQERAKLSKTPIVLCMETALNGRRRLRPCCVQDLETSAAGNFPAWALGEARSALQAPQEEKEESHQEAIAALQQGGPGNPNRRLVACALSGCVLRGRDTASHPLVLPLAQETVDSLTKQLEAFQAQMRRAEESVSSRNYKQHLQEHGGLSEFWERELESLHFVIEMRNIRVRELDKRLALAEAMREQNLALEEKVCALQQENEDLCARFRKQVAISRQLSEDLLATRQALEKETRLRQELQQEKEELVFRVLGAQANPSFPLARTTPTPTQVPFLAT